MASLPGIYDPEYDGKIKLLEKGHAEAPDRPLLVVLGSSRSVGLFRPERLAPPVADDGRQVMPFNFAHTFAGPGYMYLAYPRLLDGGLRPGWAVIELTPFILAKEAKRTYATSVAAHEVGWFRGVHPTGDLAVEYARTRLLPWVRLQRPILHEYLPAWIPGPPDPILDAAYDRLGGIAFEPHHIAWNTDAIVQSLHAQAAAPGGRVENFVVGARSDRALRALLSSCREHGTHARSSSPPNRRRSARATVRPRTSRSAGTRPHSPPNTWFPY